MLGFYTDDSLQDFTGVTRYSHAGAVVDGTSNMRPFNKLYLCSDRISGAATRPSIVNGDISKNSSAICEILLAQSTENTDVTYEPYNITHYSIGGDLRGKEIDFYFTLPDGQKLSGDLRTPSTTTHTSVSSNGVQITLEAIA
jgi:hypothetical protein